MIVRTTVVTLGLSQLICWGISYYLVAVFGEAIAAELGWSRSIVHGGFSVALLIMALSSRLAGALIDRLGGRRVMASGSVLTALGCAGLALSHTLFAYYAAWACLGLAMRLPRVRHHRRAAARAELRGVRGSSARLCARHRAIRASGGDGPLDRGLCRGARSRGDAPGEVRGAARMISGFRFRGPDGRGILPSGGGIGAIEQPARASIRAAGLARLERR